MTIQGGASTEGRSAPLWKVIAVLVVAITGCLLVMLHVPGLNGPRYWVWSWRRLDSRYLYPDMLAAALPFFFGQWLLWRRPERGARLPILFAMMSSFALGLVACCNQLNPPGMHALYRSVVDGDTNGYFWDAGQFVARRDRGEIDLHTFLSNFPKYMPTMAMHGRTRPPGNTLFYVPFHQFFSDEWNAAVIAGMVIGGLASLSIPATYLLVRELTGSRRAAIIAFSYLALCPGFVAFFSAVDTVYPALSALLIVTWLRTIRLDHLAYAAAFGLLLAVICFSSFNLLTLGAFLCALSGTHYWMSATDSPASRSRHWRRFALYVVAAAGAFAIFWLILWCVSGFDIVATFRTALKDQAAWNVKLNRPFPTSIPWDLYDFILASGWISAAIVAMGWKSWRARRLTTIVLICLAQPLLVACLAVLQTETARVWLFMQPLIMVPVGLELTRWSPRQRAVVYIALTVCAAVIVQNMWMLGWSHATHHIQQ